jgi:hypothetical protein
MAKTKKEERRLGVGASRRLLGNGWKKRDAIKHAADRVVAHVDKMRVANLYTGLNMQVQWMIQDAADAGAKFRKSQAPVVGLYATMDRLYVHYRDNASCMFKDMMGNLTPSVANDNFIGYTVPDGSGPR